jgi:predicted peptidase
MSETKKIITGTQNVVVEGFDWGPAVTKTILSLSEPVTGAPEPSDFTVTERKESFCWDAVFHPEKHLDPTKHIQVEQQLTVTDCYLSDQEGTPVEGPSAYLTVAFYYDPSTASPYCFDLLTMMNTECDPYELKIQLCKENHLSTEKGEPVTGIEIPEKIQLQQAKRPQLEKVDLTGVYTAADGVTLTYSSYEPENQGDGQKHPLVIWLHGAGEGGKDPSLALLGNKVTALYGQEFQDIMGGAYVLTPQTPTFWLTYNEKGEWQDNPGTDSYYLPAAKELIRSYVAAHPAIDEDRIYLCGCSNGGYMTVNMILDDPHYFAAAVPICEAYNDAGITDAQLEGIKELPVWFVYSEADDVVDPKVFEAPTIQRLRQMGANVHTSIFPDVHDTTGKYHGPDGAPHVYSGHWSWTYFFNNLCQEEGTNLWQWMAKQHR